jgi:hypothetical protein
MRVTRHPGIAYDEDAAPAIGLAYRREGLTSSASGDYSAREMILEGEQGGVHLLLGDHNLTKIRSVLLVKETGRSEDFHSQFGHLRIRGNARNERS